MRYRLLSLLFLAVFVGNLNGAEPTRIVWIYLTDKGAVADWAVKARETLSSRSLARRAKIRWRTSLVDRQDLPVYGPYVQTIESTVTRIRHESKWLNAVSAEVTEAQERALLRLPWVREIRPVRAFERISPPTPKPSVPKDVPAHGLLYGNSYDQLAQIRVPHLHRLGYTGNGVLVCVLDTGFFKDHESLISLDVRAERDFVFSDVDTQRDPANPEDYSDSHGTATWSALGGHAPERLLGPAYGASFLLAKTEDLRYELPVEEDHWVAAVEWAEAEGADVISSSLAYTIFEDGSGYSFEQLDGNTAVTTVAADRAAALGVAVVVAAGNYRTTSWGHIGTPADGDSVIAAGAVDGAGVVASFSSPGPTADGRIKPEVCARGVNTYGASNSASWAYTSLSGTSMSTPLVAGVAALLLEVNPTWTGADVRSALMETADRNNDPNNDVGWGIVDAFAASGVQAPVVFLDSVIIDDDDFGESMGNGNTIPEAGERLELSVTLTNDGSTASGGLVASLACQEPGVDVLSDEMTFSSISPGETIPGQNPFLLDLSPSLAAGTEITLSLVARTISEDTLLVDTATITTRAMAQVSGVVCEASSGLPIGDGTVRIIDLDDTPPPTFEHPVASNGEFSAWLTVGHYALQARKEGYISTDAVVVELVDSANVQVSLTQPIPAFSADSLIFIVPPDTVQVVEIPLSNTGSGTMVMSYHVLAAEDSVSRDNDQWLVLRSDPLEYYATDIRTVSARACSSEISLKVTSAAPWTPGNGTKLVVGLRADRDADSGLEAAGIPADYKVEWHSTAALFRAYAGMWRFASSVEAESENDTLTIHVPRDEILFPSQPLLDFAIRIEDSTNPDTTIFLDSIPDDGGTAPMTFSLTRASWLFHDDSSIAVPAGQTTSLLLSVDSRGLVDGIYQTELILQGGFTDATRLPATMVVGNPPDLPERPLLGVPYPNPVVSSFSVWVTLPHASDVHLVMTDLAGRTVQRWNGGTSIPGIPMLLNAEVDPSVPRGVFLLRLETTSGPTPPRTLVRD